MAKITTSFLPANASVNVNEIYKECLYDPTDFIDDSGNHTFEALNGGLTSENISQNSLSETSSPTGGFTSEYFRSGSFARGYFYGFNFPDRYHQHQFTQDTVSTESEYQPETMSTRTRFRKKFFTPSYSLCANVFIPYDSVVYVTYQGFFATNCVCGTDKKTSVNASGDDSYDRRTYIGEYYNNRLYVDGKYQYGTEVRSPPSVKAFDSSTVKIAMENRFRWHHKSKMIHLTKGYHDFSVMVSPSLIWKFESGKQQVFCGSISVLAIKSGKEKEIDGNLEWYGIDLNGVPAVQYSEPEGSN